MVQTVTQFSPRPHSAVPSEIGQKPGRGHGRDKAMLHGVHQLFQPLLFHVCLLPRCLIQALGTGQAIPQGNHLCVWRLAIGVPKKKSSLRTDTMLKLRPNETQ